MTTLAGAAHRAHRLVGAAVAYDPLVGEPIYRDVLEDEFDYVTPENDTKWGPLQPVDARHWSFARADAIVEAADDEDQEVRGHTLVWHNQLPPFVNDSLSARELERMLDRHIDRVVERYDRDIRAWDVVNEAIADDGTPRDTVFRRVLGPGYIAHAFREAHRADCNARLFYNDYNTETIGPKSDAVYALVSSLRSARVPIDGVGFQMHLDARSAPGVDAMVANLTRFSQLGLSVNISELDVRIAGVPGDLPTRLGVQKQVYHRVVAACMAVPRCESITTWGFTDLHSWIDSVFGPDDPLPFDEQYRRKPAFYAMADGFLGVPPDAPGTAPNLIGNATFELGTDAWTTWGGTLAATEAKAHTGESSAQVTARTATFHGPVIDVRPLVRAGRGYDVSAWARVSAASDAVKLTAKLRCTNGPDQFVTLASGTATNTGWTSLTGELAVPSCTLDELSLYVEGPAAGVTLYVDDVALRPQPGELGPNLIANPGFETGTSPWFGFGGPTLSTTTAQAHGGAQSGLVTNRTATFQGPGYNLLGLAVPGGTYQANAWARIEGAAAAPATLTLKSTCSGQSSQFRQIASTTASNTAWALVAGTFTVPSCTLTELTIYLEGPAAGVDQLIDDVSVRQDLSSLEPNVITNPGFENGVSPWFPFGSPTLTATPAQAHSGAQSVLASNRTATFHGPGYSLLGAVTPGSYAASGWVRLADPGSTQVRMTLKTRCGTTDQFTTVGSATATDAGWVQISGTLAVASCTLTDLVMYFEGPAAGVSFYVDDVAVRRLPAQNLASNPGFETSAAGWFAFGGGTLAATAAQAHGGAQSGVLTGRTASFQGPALDLLAVAGAGKRYEISAWTRLGGSTGDAQFITAKTTCSGAASTFTRVATGTATDAAWTRQSGVLAVPSCTLTELVVYFEGPAAAVDVYIDDATVFEVP